MDFLLAKLLIDRENLKSKSPINSFKNAHEIYLKEIILNQFISTLKYIRLNECFEVLALSLITIRTINKWFV
jgi:hypothetical protein